MIKKIMSFCAVMMLISGVALAKESFIEFDGHINTGLGYEYLSQQPAANYGSYFAQQQMNGLRTDTTNKQDFKFYLGDVMLAANKKFGDVATARAELLFGRMDSYSNNNFSLGQAYATVNIKKLEILAGRFIAPMGFESPYINENDLPTYSLAYTYLLPHYLTGIKGYYEFNDNLNIQLWAANDLRDSTFMKNDIPAFGLKVATSYENLNVNIAGAISPETDVTKYGRKTYLIDVNATYKLNDKANVLVDGVYRYDSALKGFQANKYYSALGKFTYNMSDKWDGTLMYTFLRDVNGLNGNAVFNTLPASQMHVWGPGTSATGIDGDYHEVALGTTYHITDGAKLQTMYRLDIVKEHGFKRGLANTVIANLAYSF